MTKVVILTSAYPYYPGEQFLEDEIEYWGKSEFDEVYLLPSVATGIKRNIPMKIKLDNSLAIGGAADNILYIIKAIFSRIVWKELACLVAERKLNLYTLARALIDGSRILKINSRLQEFLRKNGRAEIVYCYWNAIPAYAACIAKKNGFVGKVVTRIHGGDLYEERRKYNYMPFKQRFSSQFDKIFSLSEQGKSYIIDKYGFLPGQVEVSRLGVPLSLDESKSSPEECFHVVSVSFCIPLKRIDKIIEAISVFASREFAIKIKWTHIGGGPLLIGLINQAKIFFADKENLTHRFEGDFSKNAVNEFYVNNSVDVFINASETEGIPVSIMEAMSYGVPAIAPNIGGISNLINAHCGVLLSSNPDAEEIASALQSVLRTRSQSGFREMAKKKIDTEFNAELNYVKFVERLFRISCS